MTAGGSVEVHFIFPGKATSFTVFHMTHALKILKALYTLLAPYYISSRLWAAYMCQGCCILKAHNGTFLVPWASNASESEEVLLRIWKFRVWLMLDFCAGYKSTVKTLKQEFLPCVIEAGVKTAKLEKVALFTCITIIHYPKSWIYRINPTLFLMYSVFYISYIETCSCLIGFFWVTWPLK